ncbi:MAG: TolC family protein, partial [Ignavibacteriaceae bacterium]|nr:TolC family protein [Ignavibacteriaceae bacterium]
MKMLKTNFIWIISVILLVRITSVCVYPKPDDYKVDTVFVSLKTAEERFLKENLQLLASRYNINAADAQITQAGLWSNPNISIEQNIYNQSTRRYFDFTRTGNTEVQIQQLFVLAGKKDKQVHISEINKQLSEFSFYDLLRTLKYQLRTDYYDLFFLQQSLKFYNESIPNLSRTIESVEGAYNKKLMLLSDVIRLKSLLLSLQNEKLGIENQITELQNDLHVLLNDTTSKSTYYV